MFAATLSASVIICAGAGWSGCACSTSRSTRWWPPSSGGSRPGAVVREPSAARRTAGALARAARLRVRRRARALARAPTRRSHRWSATRSRSSAKALRIWAAGHLNKSREVTSSGPYRWFAHPLYVGSSVMGVGLALASGKPDRGRAHRGVSGASRLRAAIRNEEAFLRRTFGDRYDRYRAASACAGRARGAIQPGAGDGQSASTARVAGSDRRVLLLLLKATYNGTFWRAAGP